MIKKLSVFIIILGGILIGIYSCERDDLCPETTQTTASVVIETFDALDPEQNKNVFGLRIQGIDNDEVLEGYDVVSSGSLVLPLRTDADETQYRLHQDYEVDDNDTPDDPSDDIFLGNEDIITITYIREDVYVSRACGYKTVYNNVRIVLQDDSVDTDQWINRIQAENDNQIVENEAETHFKLFH
ncbi:MAG: DUF6452 family protein [Jejuia sp.]